MQHSPPPGIQTVSLDQISKLTIIEPPKNRYFITKFFYGTFLDFLFPETSISGNNNTKSSVIENVDNLLKIRENVRIFNSQRTFTITTMMVLIFSCFHLLFGQSDRFFTTLAFQAFALSLMILIPRFVSPYQRRYTMALIATIYLFIVVTIQTYQLGPKINFHLLVIPVFGLLTNNTFFLRDGFSIFLPSIMSVCVYFFSPLFYYLPYSGFHFQFENWNQNFSVLYASSVLIVFLFINATCSANSTFKFLTSMVNQSQEIHKYLISRALPPSVSHHLISNRNFPVQINFACVVFLKVNCLSQDLLNDNITQILVDIDQIAKSCGLVKVKNVGPVFFGVCGVFNSKLTFAEMVASVLEFSLQSQSYLENIVQDKSSKFFIECGISSGVILHGILGRQKYVWDVWGSAVNLASRFQSLHIPDIILTDQATALLYEEYASQPRYLDFITSGLYQFLPVTFKIHLDIQTAPVYAINNPNYPLEDTLSKHHMPFSFVEEDIPYVSSSSTSFLKDNKASFQSSSHNNYTRYTKNPNSFVLSSASEQPKFFTKTCSIGKLPKSGSFESLDTIDSTATMSVVEPFHNIRNSDESFGVFKPGFSAIHHSSDESLSPLASFSSEEEKPLEEESHPSEPHSIFIPIGSSSSDSSHNFEISGYPKSQFLAQMKSLETLFSTSSDFRWPFLTLLTKFSFLKEIHQPTHNFPQNSPHSRLIKQLFHLSKDILEHSWWIFDLNTFFMSLILFGFNLYLLRKLETIEAPETKSEKSFFQSQISNIVKLPSRSNKLLIISFFCFFSYILQSLLFSQKYLYLSIYLIISSLDLPYFLWYQIQANNFAHAITSFQHLLVIFLIFGNPDNLLNGLFSPMYFLHFFLCASFSISLLNFSVIQNETLENTLVESASYSFHILDRIFPPQISKAIQSGTKLEKLSQSHSLVTFINIDLVNFTEFSLKSTPHDILIHLNAIFSIFDTLSSIENIEKLKTVGDAWIGTNGLFSDKSPQSQAKEMIVFAKKCLQELDKYSHTVGIQFEIRIIIHSGECHSGILGDDRIGFDVWGASVSSLENLERYCPPQRILVTENVSMHLSPEIIESNQAKYLRKTHKPDLPQCISKQLPKSFLLKA